VTSAPEIADLMLRAYAPADEDAAIELWWCSWQRAYPAIDSTTRLD
jgi:putative acetyltransferase